VVRKSRVRLGSTVAAIVVVVYSGNKFYCSRQQLLKQHWSERSNLQLVITVMRFVTRISKGQCAVFNRLNLPTNSVKNGLIPSGSPMTISSIAGITSPVMCDSV
jgi:hypothetical protein